MGAVSGTTLATIMAIKAGGDLLGAISGHLASRGDFKEAKKAFDNAMAEINAIGAGPDLSKQILFKQFKSAGLLTPEIEKEIDVGVSKVAAIKEDPRFKKTQIDALTEIERRGKTGFTPEELLQIKQQRAQAERAATAKDEQIIAQMRARGALDSGVGTRALMRSSEDLAARQMEAADRAAAMSSQRALQAITQAGSLAGQIRGQEFDIERTKAGAEDELNRFRVSAAMNREQRRAMYENQARQYNLAQQQQLMNMNTSMYNQEQIRRRQAEQQEYQNQLTRAGLRSGMFQAQQQMYQQRGQATQQAYGAMGSALGSGIGSLYGMGAFSSAPAAASASTAATTGAGLQSTPTIQSSLMQTSTPMPTAGSSEYFGLPATDSSSSYWSWLGEGKKTP